MRYTSGFLSVSWHFGKVVYTRLFGVTHFPLPRLPRLIIDTRKVGSPTLEKRPHSLCVRTLSLLLWELLCLLTLLIRPHLPLHALMRHLHPLAGWWSERALLRLLYTLSELLGVLQMQLLIAELLTVHTRRHLPLPLDLLSVLNLHRLLLGELYRVGVHAVRPLTLSLDLPLRSESLLHPYIARLLRQPLLELLHSLGAVAVSVCIALHLSVRLTRHERRVLLRLDRRHVLHLMQPLHRHAEVGLLLLIEVQPRQHVASAPDFLCDHVGVGRFFSLGILADQGVGEKLLELSFSCAPPLESDPGWPQAAQAGACLGTARSTETHLNTFRRIQRSPIVLLQ